MVYLRISLIFLSFLCGNVASFVPSTTTNPCRAGCSLMSEAAKTESASSTPQSSRLSMPLSWDEMIRQAASAMKEAAAAGQTRQIVRVLLPRDATNADFGKYMEDEATTELDLVPPDESWQGGIMQLYRAAGPTAENILRRLTAASGLPPRIKEDRSIDESGVDGVGLFTTDDMAISCFVQPTQEIVDAFIERAEKATNDQMVVLLNPQWRQVDDALDSASQGDGFLSGLASFLGGKGGVLKRMSEVGYTPVYTLEGYVCRGANVRLLQAFRSSDDSSLSDWQVFCERDNGESYIAVGSSKTRPTYQQVENMLIESDIGYKYARDIGLEPKL